MKEEEEEEEVSRPVYPKPCHHDDIHPIPVSVFGLSWDHKRSNRETNSIFNITEH